MQSSFFVQSTDLPGYLHEPKLPHQAPATPTLDERPGRDLFCPLQVHQRPVDDRERHRLARLDELREGSHSAIVARYTRTACRALHIFRRPGMRAASMAACSKVPDIDDGQRQRLLQYGPDNGLLSVRRSRSNEETPRLSRRRTTSR